MKIGPYLKELRLTNNLTTKQVEIKTGISNSYISLIERSQRKPSAEILSKLAKAYKVKTENLLRLAGYLPPEKTEDNPPSIPIYHIISTQKPFFIAENIEEGYGLLPLNLETSSIKNLFAIRVKDKSMTHKKIEEGDILIIRKQSEVDSQALALILLNNKIAVKRVIKQNKYLILQGANLEDLPILVQESDEFEIIGKIEWVIHKF